MPDTLPTNGNGATPDGLPGPIFAAPQKQPRELPIVPLAIAGGAILLLLAALFFFTRGSKPLAANQPLPLDPYAAQLSLTNLKMSESTSLAEGKDTYIDGTLTNSGPRTVTAATVQVIFRNDLQLAPQFESTPVMLIRSREPYIDTQTLDSAPLAPGASADFRLTFENITSSWNQQLPEIRTIHVSTR